MAFTNKSNKDLHFKIIYLGPQGAGKASNLRSILNCTIEEQKSPLPKTNLMETKVLKANLFSFLPLSLGKICNYNIRLHLYAVNLEHISEISMMSLMTGVDGIVQVMDSSAERISTNLQSHAFIKKILAEEVTFNKKTPIITQYNKRDAHDCLELEVMHQELKLEPQNTTKAIALESKGTIETLQMITSKVLSNYKLQGV